MAIEKFANNATTTTSGSINNSSNPVTFTVASASAFPTSGNFRIIIDSEILLVTSVSGSDFTATRAQEGTSIASHASGATVKHILTADSLDQTIKDRIAVGTANNYDAGNARFYQCNDAPVVAISQTHAIFSPVMPIYEFDATTYTWFNQSTATITQSGPFSAYMTTPSSSSDIRGLVTTYTPGQTIEVWCNPAFYAGPDSSYLCIGLTVGNSTDNKRFNFYPRFRGQTGNNRYDMARDYFTNNSSFSNNSTIQFIAPHIPYMLRITDNGSGTATLKYSIDGINFLTHETYNYSALFTANRAGICMFNSTGIVQGAWFHNFRIY